jgi:hypothetical protein
MNSNARLLSALSALAALSLSGCSLLVDPAKSAPLQTAEGFCNSVQDVAYAGRCDAFGLSGAAAAATQISILAPEAALQVFEAYRGRCDALQAEVDAGRYRYDAGKAKECLDVIQRRGCRGLDGAAFAWPAECERILEGKVPENSECLHDGGSLQVLSGGYALLQGSTRYRLTECVAGTVCYVQAGLTSGRCVRPTETAGAPCYPPGPARQDGCRAGLYCDYGNTCEPTLAYDGAPCPTDPRRCDPSGWVCDPGTTQCISLPFEGQACTAGYAECAPGLVCDHAVAPGTCVKRPAEPIASGQYSPSASGVGNFCGDGLFRDSLGTCAPQKGDGAPCAVALNDCRPGLACDSSSGTCALVGALGTDCSTAASSLPPCLPGLICSGAEGSGIGRCALPPGVGEPCAMVGVAQCAPGLRAASATSPPSCTCVPFTPEGATCTVGATDECGLDQGTGRQCVYVPSLGVSICQRVPSALPAGWFARGIYQP